MRALVDRLGVNLRRLATAERGVAAVEFALILPLLLTLYVGSVELSSAITVDKRVATVAGSLGDLVARADSTIASTDVTDFFAAAATTMAPYASTGVKQIVSCVKVSSTGVSKVGWSVAYNGATAYADKAAYTLPTELKTLALNGYVIVAEARMSYTPLFGYFFKNAFSLYHQYFFLPRFDGEIKLGTKTCNVS